MVVTKTFSSGSGKGQQDTVPDREGEGPPQGTGHGNRKQLMVTMPGKKVNLLVLISTYSDMVKWENPNPFSLIEMNNTKHFHVQISMYNFCS